MLRDTQTIRKLVLQAAKQARTGVEAPMDPAFAGGVQWPHECLVGPGLEGAIACESKVGYVNGTQGSLLYRGYDIFDLCAGSTFEEVSYLLLHGDLPTARQLEKFNQRLIRYRALPQTLRLLMGFPIERMNAMAALRMGTNLMRQELTRVDEQTRKRDPREAIGTDEDSVPMETMPTGEEAAVYEFMRERARRSRARPEQEAADRTACYHLVAGVGTVAAAIARLRQGRMPLEPDPELSHAANYLYMITGRRPTPVEERIMDICLILHADHGMNASTFAAIVVASTLSDIYASVGAGIAALNGPLHGGANEEVVRALVEIGDPEKVPDWVQARLAAGKKVMGFGHRVYKTYDPRARILGPLARRLTGTGREQANLFSTARALEDAVVARLGKSKGVYPNVDYFSGLVYTALGIRPELFTPTFAVARVAGWTARVLEYLENNRIFRPRAIYTGALDRRFVALRRRGKGRRGKEDPL